MSGVDRKAELERKKARLDQMRLEKKRKEEERRKKSDNDASPAVQKNLRTETEEMLQDLGIPKASPQPPAGAHPGAPKTLPLDTAASADTQPGVVAHSVQKKLILSISKVTQTNIAPRDNVQYDKTTQTIVEVTDKEARPWDYYGGSTGPNSPYVGSSPRGSGSSFSRSPAHRFAFPNLEWDDEFSHPDDDNDSMDTPPVTGGHGPPGHKESKPSESEQEAVKEPTPEPKVRELSVEERERISNSEDFMRFFDKATRIVERAMTEKIDLFTDYTGVDATDQDGGLGEGERIKIGRTFYDDRWSRFRTITSLDWSQQYPELLLASYNNNDDAPNEPDGVALIWNQKYKKTTPEYIFHCQSPVVSACFAKFHPNLIVGGTYSGRIVLWDNRLCKRTPVQRTPLNAASHTHPVYCVNVVGTQNAYNLISISTDGKMCSWNLDTLSQPQDSIELQHKQSKSVAVTCMSFMSADVNNFVVGSEEGAIYTGCRHGSKAGIADMFDGHSGPITGIDTHNVPGVIDFSSYFITSSFDWAIKLWSTKESKPLYSFEGNTDYVYDAQWSPIHPAMFCTVDGIGKVDLWNLNNDTEVPTASITSDNNLALNRCRWHQSGHQIAAGDDMGKLHIYDIAESLATPRTDEWSRFAHTLQELKNDQADQHDEAKVSTYGAPLR